MSIYRRTIWFYKGWKEYTRNGYITASKNFRESDLDIDCLGRVYMVTGANSGIGKCVSIAIAQKGGTVHMVCRNRERAEEAKKHITEITSNSNIFIHEVDLSNPLSVCEFVTKFVEANDKLDVLVNNAGCMVPMDVSNEGMERNFATNTLAPHILTKALQPLLQKSDDGRVVMVSSGGMLTQKLNVDDIQSTLASPFDPRAAYAQQKRQQVVLTEEYARKDAQVFYAAMHPGWADTPAVQSAMPDFYAKMKDRLRTAEEGADTVIWLSVSKAAVEENRSGLFFQDRQPVPSHLPLAWTESSQEDRNKLIQILDDYVAKLSRPGLHKISNL